MILITDTREQAPLTFQFVNGVSVKSECLPVGDYTARFEDGKMASAVWERKSIPDLFSSFSSGYENEKKKIEKAKALGLRYILAIEGTVFDVREGHQYRKDGEVHESKKSGLSQIRQLMTMTNKGYFEIVWCKSRAEMAFLIQEYFLAAERIRNEPNA